LSEGELSLSGRRISGAPSRCVGEQWPGLTAMQQSVTGPGRSGRAGGQLGALYASRRDDRHRAGAANTSFGAGRMLSSVVFVALFTSSPQIDTFTWRRPSRGRTPKAAAGASPGGRWSGWSPHCLAGVLCRHALDTPTAGSPPRRGCAGSACGAARSAHAAGLPASTSGRSRRGDLSVVLRWPRRAHVASTSHPRQLLEGRCGWHGEIGRHSPRCCAPGPPRRARQRETKGLQRTAHWWRRSPS